MKFDQIIFDFDGVILNSHNIKTQAFYKIFKKYGKKIATKSKNYHTKNAGISRYVKFKYILKYFVKKKINNKEIKSLSLEFKKICLEKIIKLKISKKLLRFLKTKYKNHSFFISTGTPQKEIESILKLKKIHKYFKKVYGSPLTKIQHINKIKKKSLKTLYIGDSYEDYISSKKTNIEFLLKVHSENEKFFRKKKIKKIKNFNSLEKKINLYY